MRGAAPAMWLLVATALAGCQSLIGEDQEPETLRFKSAFIDEDPCELIHGQGRCHVVTFRFHNTGDSGVALSDLDWLVETTLGEDPTYGINAPSDPVAPGKAVDVTFTNELPDGERILRVGADSSIGRIEADADAY